ncbi:bile acid:sodium symporter family protein [Tannerella forsythia]|uniref:Bile acid:sodium symporter family protein n=1 Tax=Tannerella forsythia TaxID=28112 RepID=A0A3P1YKI8_TANFO|nr:bile acid:sodium symporter family protein [Tannerella forsythia]RRD71531.1 bile acid:sodium symporter family protein [Tannerella forsythia]
MNAIWIVLPILSLLMFDLGLTLEWKDFLLFRRRPRAVFTGLVGQIIVLPALAMMLGWAFSLPPLFFIGLVLIACSPGGSSSNIFSMLAKGDVALSVTLTALSSVITLFTLPFIMGLAVHIAGGESIDVHLPVGGLIIQNLLLMLLPIAAGVFVRRRSPSAAIAIDRALSRIAFPALILLATLFFVQHRLTIREHIGLLGGCITAMILLATFAGAGLARAMRLQKRERRTIIIEVGMQNAAQGIAVATSPIIFNNDLIAVPSIIYALLMNIILLIYVGGLKRLDHQPALEKK